jgi:hypothetical protein
LEPSTAIKYFMSIFQSDGLIVRLSVFERLDLDQALFV